MHEEFWLTKWRQNEIGFHTPHPHSGFVQYFPALGLPKGSRIFVPLCGKTLDIHWLIKKGYTVVGVELSRLAVEQLFMELGIAPDICTLSAEVTVFEGHNIKIFVANIFALTASMLGPVDMIYDRAALVALPEGSRIIYAQHISEMTCYANQFLICVEYDQARLSGPPFAIMAQDLERYYAQFYTITSIDRQPVARGIKGKEPGYEHIWFLPALRAENSK
ncbi:thiopurine S-methyltransferase [Acetobacter lambici]|uniref:Thiopurine S-methyltransferase n=1 Tax=Acetobacter lambici TaxID=1332824 RepID=A0ABT1F363_9PROT|nr:thiopurine S-methyltransferase [Acetobacter lambici]MCP1242137.1 thiopurine S-methyltransferase [Acetobacter lambici]MCP1258179.1 thiopurine S-methyltransferase [Acetobacter lambici]NHO56070.1 thiopurine S-methyltransferase [Acetobacter lambici]